MTPALLYLDVCTIHRPFDDLSSSAMLAESGCVLFIIDAARAGRVKLVTSAALETEALASVVPERQRAWSQAVLSLAHSRVSLSSAVETRAGELMRKLNLATFDALHLASAETENATLITGDNQFLRRVQRQPTVARIAVVDVFTMASTIRGRRR